MKGHTTRFWMQLVGRMGPPVFAATLVGCFLSGTVTKTHVALMATGLAMIYVHHRVCEHDD